MQLPYWMHWDSAVPFIMMAVGLWWFHQAKLSMPMPPAVYWGACALGGAMLVAVKHIGKEFHASLDDEQWNRIEATDPTMAKSIKAVIDFPFFLSAGFIAMAFLGLLATYSGGVWLVHPLLRLGYLQAFGWIGGWAAVATFNALWLTYKMRGNSNRLQRSRRLNPPQI